MRSALVLVLAVAACGRVGFDACPATCGSTATGSGCTADRDCATGHCADGVCCDSACDGTCDSCATGTCVAMPSACSGDCATCAASGDGFSCEAMPAACTGACGAGTCGGSGTIFTCNFGTCCSTAIAPNLTFGCATDSTAVLPSGCQFHADYSSYVAANNFVNVMWDYEECRQGQWVSVDSGGDAFPCSGCTQDTHTTWSDTCGSATMKTVVCP